MSVENIRRQDCYMPYPWSSCPAPLAALRTSFICSIVDALSALYALSFSFYPGNGLVRENNCTMFCNIKWKKWFSNSLSENLTHNMKMNVTTSIHFFKKQNLWHAVKNLWHSM